MKPGEKYIIEIDRVVKGPRDIAFVKGFNALVFDQYGLDHLERYDDKKVRKTIDSAVDAAYKRGWKDCFAALPGAQPAIDDAYKRGMDDAWGIVRAMYKDYAITDLKRLFNCKGSAPSDILSIGIVCKHTAMEVKEKLEAFKKEKSEIHLGDEVRIMDVSKTFFVTHISDNLGRDGLPYYSGIKKDGLSAGCCGSGLEKTGRHVDVSVILGKTGGPEL